MRILMMTNMNNYDKLTLATGSRHMMRLLHEVEMKQARYFADMKNELKDLLDDLLDAYARAHREEQRLREERQQRREDEQERRHRGKS